MSRVGCNLERVTSPHALLVADYIVLAQSSLAAACAKSLFSSGFEADRHRADFLQFSHHLCAEIP
jgi:hypothetical protein